MDDVLLLSRLANGDEQALAELYQRHSAKVYALGLRMLSSKEEAEEMLQDTFYKLYKKAASFRGFAMRDGDASVGTFIYSIARNEALMRLREKRSRPQGTSELLETLSTIAARDPIDTAMIEKALSHLGSEDRTLVQQAFFWGYSHSELAERFGLPLGTVKSRLRRALLSLRTFLEEHEPS
jgi:RNA polymerase sigma-70 factor, ECF subfamily